MSELVVRICLGEEDGEVRVGALDVPDGKPIADADFRQALALLLRAAADRISPPKQHKAKCRCLKGHHGVSDRSS